MYGKIEDIINQVKAELNTARVSRRSFANISGNDFKTLFLLKANIEIAKRNCNIEFVLDGDNSDIMNELFYYIVGNPRFKGDLNKGIFLGGDLGRGKTIIMKAFCEVWNLLCNTNITQYSSREIAELVITKTEPYSQKGNDMVIDYFKAPVYIDDMGKEPMRVLEYGTEICPMNDILAKRYDLGSLTFATGNFNLETLEPHYGATITDRMKEMFNIIGLKGESRRK